MSAADADVDDLDPPLPVPPSLALPPPRWVLPGLVPGSGLTLLAGRERVDVAVLAAQIARAAEDGGELLGRRLEARPVSVAADWPRLDLGGSEAIGEWLGAHHGGLLVLPDLDAVLPPLRPGEGGCGLLADLDAMAIRHGGAVLAVTQKPRCPGALSALLALDCASVGTDAVLRACGRGVAPREVALAFRGAAWTLRRDGALAARGPVAGRRRGEQAS